jgi:putative CocE/NonD family hydrolase
MVRIGPDLLRAKQACDPIKGRMKRLPPAFILLTAIARLGAQAQAPVPRSVSHYDDAKLSQPRYKVRREANVRVPMRDGVTLATDIYFPDAPGKFPAILVRTPYNKATAQSVPQGEWFAGRGYVVLEQDVRGRWDSDGHFYAFKNEANDGFDMDEWIGQQPWFNGKLGTMGGSYVGYTQWAQAVGGSKYLTAIAPQVTTPDIYGNWFYIDGALHYGFAFPWGGISIDGHTAQYNSGNDWTNMFRHLPVATSDEAAYHRTPHYRDWLAHPTRDSYWNGISWDNDYEKIGVPAYSVDGWFDIFMRGALHDDQEIRKHGKTQEARAGKRIMIGPWAHSQGGRYALTGNGADPNPVDFGDNAVVDMQKVYLRWFDYWLKGMDNGVATEPPIKIFVMGENYWRYENEWPLARTKYTNYYLHSNGKANSAVGEGTLSTEAPADSVVDTFAYDPAHPVPSMGGNVCCSVVPSGPWDQRPVEHRDDVLIYTAPPVTEPMEVTGPISMTLFAATTAKDTDWTAKLVDVYPNGYAQNVQSGIVRARYRDGAGKAANPIKPGKVYEYTIDMWATSQVFLPGHRIRLEISSSDFPRFDRNLNTGEDPNTGTRMEIARQTIYHNRDYPSHLVLPLIPRGAPGATTTASR